MQAETALGFYCPLLSRTMCLRGTRPKPQRKANSFIARCHRVSCAFVSLAHGCDASRNGTRILLPVVIAYHVFPYCSPKAAAKTETAFHLLPVVIAYHIFPYRSPTAAMQAETALGFYCPLLSRTMCLRGTRPKLQRKPNSFIARCYCIPCISVVLAQSRSENRNRVSFIARCYCIPCACVVPAQSRSEKRNRVSFIAYRPLPRTMFFVLSQHFLRRIRARILPRTCQSGIRPPAAPMQSFLPRCHLPLRMAYYTFCRRKNPPTHACAPTTRRGARGRVENRRFYSR